MRLLFATPEKAAKPVIYLCCAQEMGRRSGVYLHLMRERQASALAMDEAAGERLWRVSEALLQTHGSGAGSGTDSHSAAGKNP